jgi:hypothetical protein
VFVCYLDDSGKDPQNAITTLAGYVATEEQWQAFETEVEPIFAKRNVAILHAKELHDTDGDFKGWTRLNKQAFVAQVCAVLARHVPLGVSMSALKSTYEVRAEESGRTRTLRPYTFCFNVILDWLLRDVALGKAIHEEGLAFIVETGHENNPEMEWCFHDTSKAHSLERVLRSISFVPKEHSRAIQMADLAAFYTRRHGVEMEKAGKDVPPDPMLSIMAEKIRHRGFVATDYGGWRP